MTTSPAPAGRPESSSGTELSSGAELSSGTELSAGPRGLSLPPGLVARRPVPADAVALHALCVECEEAVGAVSDLTVEQTTADLLHPGYDRDRSGQVVTRSGPDGDVVGWLWTQHDPGAGTFFLDPYARSATVLAWLTDQAVARATELAREQGRQLRLEAGSLGQDQVLAGVLTDAGFTVERRFWRMLADLTGPPAHSGPDPGPDQGPDQGLGEQPAASSPLVVPAPAGVRITRPDPSRELTYRTMHRVLEESFAQHWNHTWRDYPAWRERFDAAAGQDPGQWWVAELDGEPVGVLVGDRSRAELNRGWVRTLGVLPSARGRGVARALLRTAFAHAAAQGWTGVGLAVDSQNATGATALYESVGMRVESVVLAWQRQVDPPPG